MMKIQDQLPQFSFGLFSECPSDVPVAWGARAIADASAGFSLLHDRQTWIGDASVREPFKVALDKALVIANRNCKRLRHGWDPIKELALGGTQDKFNRFLNRRIAELCERYEVGVEQYAKQLVNQPAFMFSEEGPVAWERALELIRSPSELRQILARERRMMASYWREIEKIEQAWERNPPSPPPPPQSCQSHEDEWLDEEHGPCHQSFTPNKSGGYEGCSLEDDCWVCDNCGYQHHIDWDDAIDVIKPKQTYTMLFNKVFRQDVFMSNETSETFEIFNDGHMVIKANTNASHGYIYLVAYPVHAEDISELKWSGKEPPPPPGAHIKISMNDIGEATVVSYLARSGYLMLNVVASNPPQFVLDNVERSESSGLLDIAGIEIG